MSAFLEPSPYAGDGGHLIGRDPREIDAAEWEGKQRLTPIKAIRAKCIDCCGGSLGEVRKCVAVDCPLWPLRMGCTPKGLRESTSEKTPEIFEQASGKGVGPDERENAPKAPFFRTKSGAVGNPERTGG